MSPAGQAGLDPSTFLKPRALSFLIENVESILHPTNKKITNGELIAYLKNNVSQEAFSQNRSQEPMLSGDPNNILISYR